MPDTTTGPEPSKSVGTVQLELQRGGPLFATDQLTIRARAGDELASAVLNGELIDRSPDLERLPEILGAAVRAGRPLQDALDEALHTLTTQETEP